MKYWLVHAPLKTGLLFGRFPPSMDGLILAEYLKDSSVFVDPFEAMTDIIGVCNGVPQSSTMRVYSETEESLEETSTTFIGGFLSPDITDRVDELPIGSTVRGFKSEFRPVVNRCFDKGAGSRGMFNNTRSTYQGVIGQHVVATVFGDGERIQNILKDVTHIGAKRDEGFGRLGGEFVLEEVESSSPYPGLVNSHGEPIRPIPLSVWSQLKLPEPKQAVLIDYRSVPPYSNRFGGPRVPSWVPLSKPILDLGDVQ